MWKNCYIWTRPQNHKQIQFQQKEVELSESDDTQKDVYVCRSLKFFPEVNLLIRSKAHLGWS